MTRIKVANVAMGDVLTLDADGNEQFIVIQTRQALEMLKAASQRGDKHMVVWLNHYPGHVANIGEDNVGAPWFKIQVGTKVQRRKAVRKPQQKVK